MTVEFNETVDMVQALRGLFFKWADVNRLSRPGRYAEYEILVEAINRANPNLELGQGYADEKAAIANAWVKEVWDRDRKPDSEYTPPPVVMEWLTECPTFFGKENVFDREPARENFRW